MPKPDGATSMVDLAEPVSVTLSPRVFTKPFESSSSYASSKSSTLILMAVRSRGMTLELAMLMRLPLASLKTEILKYFDDSFLILCYDDGAKTCDFHSKTPLKFLLF